MLTRAVASADPAQPRDAYREVLFSPIAERVLRQGQIIPDGMTTATMVSRLLCRLALIEASLDGDISRTDDVLAEFHELVRDGVVLLGSPLLTNIANGDQRPLASCSAVPQAATLDETLRRAEGYYRLNMGSGFDLSGLDDPVGALRALNAHAAEIEASGVCERYVGNMAHIDVDHPRIMEFIAAKTEDRCLIHFNFSVNLSEVFMSAVTLETPWRLRDGRTIPASDVWGALVDAAYVCGDPGIISLDRFNRDNPLAGVNSYTTTAPCAEVGLASGETCVFGYISLAPLINVSGDRAVGFDFTRLARAARILTQVLDDAVEYSSQHQPDPRSRGQHRFSRKIGIGICGYADALMPLGLRYGSETALQFLRDVMATVNYESKLQSSVLAESRGPFEGFPLSVFNRHETWTHRFAQRPTIIPEGAWHDLGPRVSRRGLRNVMTCALPPSGRVSLLLGVASSIEPYLSVTNIESQPISLNILDSWGALHRTKPDVRWPASNADGANSIVRDAYAISIDEHLDTVAAAAEFVDDGISKTLNLPHTASTAQVDYALRRSWSAGLKAMSVYRRGSHPSEATFAAAPVQSS